MICNNGGVGGDPAASTPTRVVALAPTLPTAFNGGDSDNTATGANANANDSTNSAYGSGATATGNNSNNTALGC